MRPQAEEQESTDNLKGFMPVIKLKNSPICMVLLAVLTIIALVFIYEINTSSAYAVSIGGKKVAVVKNKQDVQKIINELINEQKSKLNEEVTTGSKIEFARVDVKAGSLTESEDLKKILAGAVFFQAAGTVIKINGEDKLVLINQNEAKQVLNKVKEKYSKNEDENTKIENVFFEEKVELVDRQVRTDEILGLNQADKLITQGVKEIEQYIVQEGDNAWDIAFAQGLSVDQVSAANPDLNIEKLSIGQKINLSKKTPLLNVVVVGNETVRETLNFTRQVKQDNSLYVGQRKTIQRGIPGEVDVTYKVTERNGQEAKRQVVDKKVLKEPVTEILAKGARVLVASRGSGGTGSLAWPTGGYIISPYGMRHGRMHTGADITGKVGNPVVAAEAGKVIRAGWFGNYGKCIDIDHGNGVVTRYAHLSSYTVSVGQRVLRGQLIGRVGTTGRVTGPHLHFEVIINGKAKNPSLFL